MPSWQPNWDDVRFDHGAAKEAIATCTAAIEQLGNVRHAHVNAATSARTDWTGSASSRFDEQRTAVDAAIDGARDALDAAIAAIEAAIDEAHAEQRHRVSERQRWRDERDAENAAAAAAAAAAAGAQAR
jgi:hypothetical protein